MKFISLNASKFETGIIYWIKHKLIIEKSFEFINWLVLIGLLLDIILNFCIQKWIQRKSFCIIIKLLVEIKNRRFSEL